MSELDRRRAFEQRDPLRRGGSVDSRRVISPIPLAPTREQKIPSRRSDAPAIVPLRRKEQPVRKATNESPVATHPDTSRKSTDNQPMRREETSRVTGDTAGEVKVARTTADKASSSPVTLPAPKILAGIFDQRNPASGEHPDTAKEPERTENFPAQAEDKRQEPGRGSADQPPPIDPPDGRSLPADNPDREPSREEKLDLIDRYEKLRAKGIPIHKMPAAITRFLAAELKVYTTETPRKPDSFHEMNTEGELEKLNHNVLTVLEKAPGFEGTDGFLSKQEAARVLFETFDLVRRIHLEGADFAADSKRKDGGVAKAEEMILVVPDEDAAMMVAGVLQAVHRSTIPIDTRVIIPRTMKPEEVKAYGKGYIVETPNITEYTNRTIRAGMDTLTEKLLTQELQGEQADPDSSNAVVTLPKNKRHLTYWDGDKPEQNETFSPKIRSWLEQQNEKYRSLPLTISLKSDPQRRKIEVEPENRLVSQLENVTQRVADGLGEVIPQPRTKGKTPEKDNYGNFEQDPGGKYLLIEEIEPVRLKRKPASTTAALTEGPLDTEALRYHEEQIEAGKAKVREWKENKALAFTKVFMFGVSNATSFGLDTLVSVAEEAIPDQLLKTKPRKTENKNRIRRRGKQASDVAHTKIDKQIAKHKSELKSETD